MSKELKSLRNSSKDRRRFVDAIVLAAAPYWPKRLSNFEKDVETPFEFGLRTSNDAMFCQTVSITRVCQGMVSEPAFNLTLIWTKQTNSM